MCHQPLDISFFANHWQVSGNCTSPDQLENGTFGQTLNCLLNRIQVLQTIQGIVHSWIIHILNTWRIIFWGHFNEGTFQFLNGTSMDTSVCLDLILTGFPFEKQRHVNISLIQSDWTLRALKCETCSQLFRVFAECWCSERALMKQLIHGGLLLSLPSAWNVELYARWCSALPQNSFSSKPRLFSAGEWV